MSNDNTGAQGVLSQIVRLIAAGHRLFGDVVVTVVQLRLIGVTER